MSDTPPPAAPVVPKAQTGAVLLISMVVLLDFMALQGIAFYLKNESMLQAITQTVLILTTSVVSFWIGSSVGSARKDAVIAQSTPVTTQGTTP